MSRSFDFPEFSDFIDQAPETDVDGAATYAILDTASKVLQFRQVKRRDREAAKFEAGKNVLTGYNFSRYVLGTYRRPMAYSTPETLDGNVKRILSHMDRYPDTPELLESVSTNFRDTLVVHAQHNAKGSILEKLFGLQQASEMALVWQVDGIRIALSESDEFGALF